MQNGTGDPTERQAADATSPTRPAAPTPTRRIDCGATMDDAAPVVRQERADARHAYLTARGTYAEQVQAL